MTVQRLANLHIKEERDFGPLALRSASPELMAIVADVIARWSLIQVLLGNTFAELVGARSPATVEMFASFDSFATQRLMLLTGARELLPKRYADIFRVTLTVVERAAKERHRFAHWIFGTILQPGPTKEMLLLADPKHIWKLRHKQIRHFQRFKSEAHATQPRLDLREIWVYRKDDLLKVKQQMMTAEKLAYGLGDLVCSTPRRRLEITRQLRAQPDIRLVLDSERQRKTNSPKAVRKPRPLSSRARREAALAKRK